MRAHLRRVIGSQEAGLVLVVLLVALALTVLAGSHVDRRTGELVNGDLHHCVRVQNVGLYRRA